MRFGRRRGQGIGRESRFGVRRWRGGSRLLLRNRFLCRVPDPDLAPVEIGEDMPANAYANSITDPIRHSASGDGYCNSADTNSANNPDYPTADANAGRCDWTRGEYRNHYIF